MGELGQSPDELVNQIHSVKSGQVFPVLRTDPKAYMVNDGTNDRVMMGGFGDGSYGIKVSQSGYDVKTATDAQLIMSSGFNAFKIVQSGTLVLTTVTTSGTPDFQTVSVTHGLGYVPAVLGYLEVPVGSGNYYPLPFEALLSSTVGAGLDSWWTRQRFGLEATSTTLYFTQYWDKFYMSATGNTNSGNLSPHTYTARYYLLRETAT